MSITTLSLSGGIFFIFTFVHFIVDWLFQSHESAMNKCCNSKIRSKHCLLYSFGFIPLMLLFNFSAIEFIIGFLTLFISHFIIDSYVPIYLWARYIRKPQQMNNNNNRCYGVRDMEKTNGYYMSNFFDFAQTNLGLILCIVVDQIFHIVFLIPLVWMALN